MPVATTKTTKTAKSSKTAKSTKAPSTKTPTAKTSRPRSSTAKASTDVANLKGEVKNLTEDIRILETKVSTLIKVIHDEMKTSMRSGPEGFAQTLGRSGLLD
jgi:molecular chaperone GrpE (heat shock protein)